MDYKEIKRLLDKYLEGETSLIEEQMLKDYLLNSNEIPKEFEYAKQMFLAFNMEAKENTTVSINPNTNSSILVSFWHKYSVLSGIAATILLMAGIYYFNQPSKNDVIYAYIDGIPVYDEKIAMQETKKALQLISINLNQGAKNLSYLSKLNQSKLLITKTK